VLALVTRRLIVSAPLLLLVSALVFVLTSIVPGDVTEAILGPKSSTLVPLSAYTQLREELRLDQSLPVQYWTWLSHALHGDLGASLVTHQPVSQAITQHVPVTLSLVIGGLIVSVILGVSLGVVSAVCGGWLGRTVDVLAMTGWVLPVFWIAAELIAIFAVKLRWVPAEGYVALSQSRTEWLRSLALPVAALAIAPVGLFAKFTREAMLDALGSEYVRSARACGIPRVSIVLRHAFKTASLQVVTLAGLLAIGLLVGTVFVETIFALPGLGTLIVTAVNHHDLPVVQAVTVLFTLIVVGINLVTDVIYGLLNPRVRIV